MINIIGEIWVCVDCMLWRETDEIPARAAGEPAVWSEIDSAAVGMGRVEHDNWCARSVLDDASEAECDCAEIEFSSRTCDACGSGLAGNRYAYAVFDE